MSMPVISSTAVPQDRVRLPTPTLLFSGSIDMASTSATSQETTVPQTAVSTERAMAYFQHLSEKEQRKIRIERGESYWKQIGCCKKVEILFCHCLWNYESIGKFYMAIYPRVFLLVWQEKHHITKLNGIKTPPSSPMAFAPHLSIDLQQIKPKKEMQAKEQQNVVVPLGGAPEEASCDVASTTISALRPASMAALKTSNACSSVETTSCSPSQRKN